MCRGRGGRDINISHFEAIILTAEGRKMDKEKAKRWIKKGPNRKLADQSGSHSHSELALRACEFGDEKEQTETRGVQKGKPARLQSNNKGLSV